MKSFLIVLATILAVTCASTIDIDKHQIPPSQKALKIEFTESKLDPFGLPLQIQGISALYYCLNEGEVVKDTIAPGNFLSLEGRDSIVTFRYAGEKGEINGQFLVPKFQEVIYQRTYDALTMQVSKMTPLLVYPAIRYGKWTFKEEDGEKSTKNYAIQLEADYPLPFCRPK